MPQPTVTAHKPTFVEPQPIARRFLRPLFSIGSRRLAPGFCAIIAIAGIAVRPSSAREEKWPAPTPEARREMEEARQHEEELLKQLAPQLAEWAKKGKPFLREATQPADLPQAPVPAFPGAEGGGKFSFGGRGGKVYVVTNLADSGPGTLREVCEAAGPRIAVFNVAGIIHLKMPLFIEAPYLTIAGQSAPGDGVCVAGRSTLVNTHDVVIRYLRFRRGETNGFGRDDSLGGNPIGNIIVDHCSTSWGFDENLSMYRHRYVPTNGTAEVKLPTINLTIQRCISSEALDHYNDASDGTWGGHNTLFYDNLFACDTGRDPSIGLGYDFNFVNNVIFNWRQRTLDGGGKTSRVNCINNYYQPGPIQYRIGLPQASPVPKGDTNLYYGQWHISGNYVAGNEKVSADNWAGGLQLRNGGSKEEPTVAAADADADLIKQVRAGQPFPMPHIKILSAQEAYDSVLADSGATLPHRDPVDLRIIDEVRTGKVTYEAGKGSIADVQQVGGYPDYKGVPHTDLDASGLPLWWKKKYNLDPRNPGLAEKDLLGDGYTVMDKYLDGLNPIKKIDWTEKDSNVNTLNASSFAAGL